jgi:hypothetical protein
MPISEYEPFCPNCKYGNPSFLLTQVQNNQHRDIQLGTRKKLSKAVKKELN